MSDQQKKRSSYDLYSDQEWEAMLAKNKPFSQQLKEVFQEDPGIPVFLGATCVALCGGMRQSFIKHNAQKANNYMMARVTFQGLAAGAVGYSIFKVHARDQKKVEDMVKAKAAADAQKE
eukprot:UN04580